mgnify:CR=1 FL=1
MHRVFTVKLAELFDFQTTRSISFLLGAGIISAFALSAFQNYNFTHFISPCIHPSSRQTDAVKMSCRFYPAGTFNFSKSPNYSTISETRPEATVRPPSRIAKRWVFSIAIGAISSTLMDTLSPGITIWTPSGRVMIPVTSVVLK